MIFNCFYYHEKDPYSLNWYYILNGVPKQRFLKPYKLIIKITHFMQTLFRCSGEISKIFSAVTIIEKDSEKLITSVDLCIF